MIFCEWRKREENVPAFQFFETHSGAMQRKKLKSRGVLSSLAARRKIVNSLLDRVLSKLGKHKGQGSQQQSGTGHQKIQRVKIAQRQYGLQTLIQSAANNQQQ